MRNGIESTGFLGRVATVLFALICVVAAVCGACLAFVVAAACFGIAEAILGAQLKWLEAPAALVAVLGGLFLPVYWLISKRRQQQPRIEPTFGIDPYRQATDPAAAMTPSDPTTLAAPVAAASQTTTPGLRVSTGAKWAIGAAGVVVLLVLLAGIQSSSSLDIEVRSSRPQLTNRATLHISNIGSTPITILDVLLNDRIECSMLDSHVRSAFLELDKAFTQDDFHKMWVYTGDGVGFILLGGLYHRKSAADLHTYRASLRPVELKTGDAFNWSSSCNSSMVRATVTTKNGSVSYSFSR